MNDTLNNEVGVGSWVALQPAGCKYVTIGLVIAIEGPKTARIAYMSDKTYKRYSGTYPVVSRFSIDIRTAKHFARYDAPVPKEYINALSPGLLELGIAI